MTSTEFKKLIEYKMERGEINNFIHNLDAFFQSKGLRYFHENHRSFLVVFSDGIKFVYVFCNLSYKWEFDIEDANIEKRIHEAEADVIKTTEYLLGLISVC